MSKKTLGTRGMKKVGTIVSTKARKTAIIEIDAVKFFGKYRRWAKNKSRMPVHVPEQFESVKVGDVVSIEESRKISKTKSWIITGIVSKGESQ